MNMNYKRSFFSKLVDLVSIKNPDALHGPTLLRTAGTSPGKAPQRVDIKSVYRSSSKHPRRR